MTKGAPRHRPPARSAAEAQVILDPTPMLRVLIDELKDTIREGRELLKDMRAEQKKAQQVIPMIVTKRIEVAVEKGLQEYGKEVKNATDVARDHVISEFEALMQMLLGEDKESVDEGRVNVREYIEKLSIMRPAIEAIVTGDTPRLNRFIQGNVETGLCTKLGCRVTEPHIHMPNDVAIQAGLPAGKTATKCGIESCSIDTHHIHYEEGGKPIARTWI